MRGTNAHGHEPSFNPAFDNNVMLGVNRDSSTIAIHNVYESLSLNFSCKVVCTTTTNRALLFVATWHQRNLKVCSFSRSVLLEKTERQTAPERQRAKNTQKNEQKEWWREKGEDEFVCAYLSSSERLFYRAIERRQREKQACVYERI